MLSCQPSSMTCQRRWPVQVLVISDSGTTFRAQSSPKVPLSSLGFFFSITWITQSSYLCSANFAPQGPNKKITSLRKRLYAPCRKTHKRAADMRTHRLNTTTHKHPVPIPHTFSSLTSCLLFLLHLSPTIPPLHSPPPLVLFPRLGVGGKTMAADTQYFLHSSHPISRSAAEE